MVVANSSISLFDVAGMRDNEVGGALWITAAKSYEIKYEGINGSSPASQSNLPLLLPPLHAAFYHGNQEQDAHDDQKRLLLGSSQVWSTLTAVYLD